MDPASYWGSWFQLLVLKLRCLNIKPSNPAELSFTERLLWGSTSRAPTLSTILRVTPVHAVFAIASATAAFSLKKIRRLAVAADLFTHPATIMTAAGFAAFLFLGAPHSFFAYFAAIFAGRVLWFWMKARGGGLIRESVLSIFVIYIHILIFYIFFSFPLLRFSGAWMWAFGVLTPYIAAGAGAAVVTFAFRAFKRGGTPTLFFRAYAVALACVLVAMEYENSSARSSERRSDPEMSALLSWMSEENVENVKFFCLPEMSPLIESYCGASALFPRTPRKRRGVEDYHRALTLLYDASEAEFAEFLAERKVDYVIFDSKRMLSKSLYGPRYLAVAPQIAHASPADLMSSNYGRGGMRCFHEMKSPLEHSFPLKRFIVFKVISRKNRGDAIKWALASEREAREGNRFMAARLAKSAIFADPNCEAAEIMYRKLYGKPPLIRLRGF
jgi:hypothetical protein